MENIHQKGTFNWAREEMARGKTVRRKDWDKSIGIWENTHAYFLRGSNERWTPFVEDFKADAEWEYFEPEQEKPSLTFEEALGCQHLVVSCPEIISFSEITDTVADLVRGAKWSLPEILLFDLAERRGWKMEAAE